MIQLRVFTPEDYPMICQWALAHGKGFVMPPLEHLPTIGQIAFREDGDLAAIWLYLTMATPVCFLEHGVTRPGISLKTAKEAFISMEKCLKEVAASLGYQVMISHCSPGMARVVKAQGWVTANENITTLMDKCEPAAV